MAYTNHMEVIGAAVVVKAASKIPAFCVMSDEQRRSRIVEYVTADDHSKIHREELHGA